MNPPEAKQLLRACLEVGTVKPTWHFRQELQNETILFTDVEFVLRSGAIFDPPEEDLKTGEWKYRIEGSCADRQWIAVVFCFKKVDEVWLITVFSVDQLRR